MQRASTHAACVAWGGRPRPSTRGAALLLALFVAGGQTPVLAQDPASPGGPTEPAPSAEPSGLAAAAALEQALVDCIAKAGPSVAAIARVRRDEARFDRQLDPTSPDFTPNEFASGVVISAEGHILTNHHVLGEIAENDYYVWLQRRPFRAQASVEAADPWMDLAVLKIEAQDLTPIAFGDGAALRRGRIVIALGNPLAIARDGEPSASWGIVSNLARQAPPRPSAASPAEARETLHQYGTLIQTDCRFEFGASGGALVNLQGEMVGLTTSLAALASSDAAGGFAIPVDEAFLRTVQLLREGRKPDYGFLGVAPEHLSAVERQDGRFGARILQVVPGTPASLAGLRGGDVVTHVNREPVYDATTLFRLLSELPTQSRAELTLDRNGRTTVVPVVLAKKHLGGPHAAYSRHPDPQWRGVRVDYATALPPLVFQDRSYLLEEGPCVAVIEVERDSPAWKAGLRPWSLIRRVGRRPIAAPADFYAATAELSGEVSLEELTESGETVVRRVAP